MCDSKTKADIKIEIFFPSENLLTDPNNIVFEKRHICLSSQLSKLLCSKFVHNYPTVKLLIRFYIHVTPFYKCHYAVNT